MDHTVPMITENVLGSGAAHCKALHRTRIRAAVQVALVAVSMLTLISIAGVFGLRHAPLWMVTHVTRAQLLWSGIHSRTIDIDGAQMHYLEGGSGAPVVLVHGLGGSAELDWAELMPHLVRSGYHVYAMDLLGFGSSAKPANRKYSIAEQARLVVQFLDAQKLATVALAGDSMGGWIASLVALDQSHRINQLILFDSPGLRFTPSFDLSLFTPHTLEQVDSLLALLFPNVPRLPVYVKEDLIREAQRDGWVVERAVASMLTGADLLDQRFSALKIPLLIVWGKQDILTPLSLAETMHRAAPQSVLEVYDGCGHISVKTCTDRIGPRTVSFLRGASSQAGRRIEIPQETNP